MLRKIIVTVIVAEVLGLLFFQAQEANASPAEEAARIVQTCQALSSEQVEHEKCTAHEFADLGEKKGVAFIGEVLNFYQGLNSGYQAYQNCHVLAHRIMNDLSDREPEGWKELIGQMSDGQLDPLRCGGGFMHGALEAQAARDPNFKVNADLFHELCVETLPQRMSTSCAHILGHLALVEGLGSLTEAFKSCEGLSGEFLFQCYGGIFMEDSMRTNLEVHGLAELPVRDMAWFTKQKARCDRYKAEPTVAKGCWYDLPEVFAQTHYYDIVQTYEFCHGAPNKEAKDACIIRGSYLVALAPDFMFKTFPTKELCSPYQAGMPELMRCMQDVVGAPLTGSMELLDRTIAFCSVRPKSVQTECFNMVAHHVNKHTAGNMEERSSLCSKLPEANRGLCMRET